MTKHILYIISHIDKALEFEWVAELIDKSKFQISFISINDNADTALHRFCEQHQIPFYYVEYHGKKNILSAIKKTYLLLKEIKPQVVHAHLFEGGLIGITAAWLAKIKHRIYTRHYSNYHHKYAPSGVKFDKWINKKATHIVSITQMVSDILIRQENVPANKITLIHHGFPINHFLTCSEERITNLKIKHQIPFDKKIIGVISRYTYWKGVQDIIPAFQKLYEKNKNLHLILANANGDYKKEIHELLLQLPNDSYTEISFEQDNVALFYSFDVFVHCPIDEYSEAFGQIYIEALLCQIPSVFTKSGIGSEIAVDKETCLVVPHQNSEAISNAINQLLNDETLCNKLKENGLTIAKNFTIENKVNSLENLYSI
ncbi:MAG: glycosyltransferase family 4 protein [Chitinophagales bacterium]|nr:glycosyltransferase family 4 protein [Chitinophagales bacterium]